MATEKLPVAVQPSSEKFSAEDVDEVLTCLDDDATRLLEVNEEDEAAQNMRRAATMLTWMLLTHPLYVLTQAKPDALNTPPKGTP